MDKEEIERKQWPATLDEAVGVVLASLPDTEKRRLAGLTEEELITWVRGKPAIHDGDK